MRKSFARRVFLVAVAAIIEGAGWLALASDVYAESLPVTVSVPRSPSLTIALTDPNTNTTMSEVSMDVVPSMEFAGFNEKGVNVTVGTSSASGFSLIMDVTDNALTDSSTGAKINSLAQDDVEHADGYICTIATAANCDFTVNSWGFRLASNTSEYGSPTNFLPVPSSQTLINKYTTGATNGITTGFYFGSRVNAAQAPGTYTTTVNFIATTNITTMDYMQGVTQDSLSAILPNDGDITSLYDARDDKSYLVGKLADGNYWMLENLALDSATIKSGVVLNASNTNMDPDTSFTLPESSTSGFGDDNSSYVTAAINAESKNEEVNLAVGQSGTGKVGVYYNYCAASAGTYCLGSGSGSGNAEYDICPKGWKLPTGGTNGEFQNLRNQYSSDGAMALALRMPLSGFYYIGQAYEQNSYGRFWSSTFGNALDMYGFYAGVSGVGNQSDSHRRSGFSVRCVYDKTPSLQEASVAELNSLMPTNGSTAILKDERDGKNYTIGKLADGNYWMLDNLALDPATMKTGVTLTTDNTNMSSNVNFSLPSSTTTGFGDNTTGFTNAAMNADSKNTSVNLAVGQSGAGKVGVYYNYCAASAGTYCADSNSGSGNAQYDICPKGWRLPTGGTNGEFQNLRNQYSSDGAMALALRVTLSGGFYDGEAKIQNSENWLWSSTYYGTPAMYILSAGTSSVNPQNYLHRRSGTPLRCVKNFEMQSLTSEDLVALMPTIGSTARVVDGRDNTIYTVGRLADGNFWMLDNLALDPATIKSGVTLNIGNTNMDPNANFTLPNSISGGFGSYTSAQINTDSKNSEVGIGAGQSGTTKVGVYYNYCAASAGTICSDSNSRDAQYDICPKGWRLPTGGANGEFQNLRNQYSSDGAYALASKAPRSARYSGSSVADQGYGYLWASTRATDIYMDHLRVTPSDTSQASYYRVNGFPIRCIKSFVMQDLTNNDMAALMPSTGNSVSVVDDRDNVPYRIAKLADGKYWMLDNLALDPVTFKSGVVLSANNTNMDPNTSFTLPNSISSGFNSYTSAQINTDSKKTSVNLGVGQSGTGKAGVYYNYCAASAGTICSDSISQNAQYDVCAKGWRLPTGGASGEYQALRGEYGSDGAYASTLRLLLSGFYHATSDHEKNVRGIFWTTVNKGTEYMYSALVDSGFANLQDDARRTYGLTIRCVYK